jgi:chromosome segregation ATPase
MAENWMLIAEAAGVLKCDIGALRRWADAGQLRHRAGALGTEVLLDVQAAPTVEDLAVAAPLDSGREAAIAFALARTACEEAERSRRGLKWATVSLAAVVLLSGTAIGWTSFRSGEWKVCFNATSNLLVAEQAKSAHLEQERESLRLDIETARIDAAEARLRLADARQDLAAARQEIGETRDALAASRTASPGDDATDEAERLAGVEEGR